MIKNIGSHDALYQSLLQTAEGVKMTDDEFTVSQFCEEAGMPETSARRFLKAMVESGELSSRDAIKDGHHVRAYKPESPE